MESFDYVILGAGLGGLSAAACLTRQGNRVAVLEKHYLPGGCCHTFDYGDYRFCADVHYVSEYGAHQPLKQFLNYIERDVPFNSLDPDCIDWVITPEASLRIPLGWENLRDRLLSSFPDESRAISLYCSEIEHFHHQVHDLMQEVKWFNIKPLDWLKLPKYWDLFWKQHWTLQDLYDRVGLSPKLQALLAGQSGDYALPPNEIALMSHTAIVWDYSEGAYYPKHHFKHLVDTIVDAIVAGGGVVKYSTPVEHIEVRDRKVQSVTAGGEKYVAAKAYISDLDPKLTVKLMGNPEVLSKQELQRLTDYEYSISAFNIYLGLHHTFDPQKYGIGNWNIWYYPDSNLNRAYQRQLEGDLHHPWIFLSCPTMKSDEPGMAPRGNHVLEIATVCPYEPFKQLQANNPKAYKAKKREVYQEVMASVRDLIPDVDAHARMKIFGTPTTSEYYLGQPEGNIYGAKLTPRNVGLHRMGYRTELPNLFLVGATAGYPGVPGVISNGMNVVEMITGRSIRSRTQVRHGNKVPSDPQKIG
jgi:phytoene dehydrogenase-like protein